MKRLFIAFVICAGFVSCQISDSSIRPVDGHQLFNYSSGLCGNYVTVPVELMEMLIGFDEYMNKSLADKEADARFYGKIDEMSDNVYRFNDNAERKIQCTVDTQGKSIHDKDAVWIIAHLSSWGYNEADVLTSYYDYSLPEYTEIRMTDVENSVWTISYEDLFETVLKYKGQDEGRNIWEVTATGKDVSSKSDLTAYFSTGDTPLEVKERKMNEDKVYLGNAYKGYFNVAIYSGKELKDWCHITFRPGFTTKYETNQ